MSYIHELTEIETACGVTLESVALELKRCAVRPNGDVWVDGKIGPALAGSVARAALAGPAEYVGQNMTGCAVYRRAGA